MEKNKSVWIRTAIVLAAILISLYSFLLWFGLSIGPAGKLPDAIDILDIFLSYSVFFLFFSGWFLLSLKKWSWYFTVVSIVLYLAKLNLGKFFHLEGIPFFAQAPLIIYLIFLLLPGVKKHFGIHAL